MVLHDFNGIMLKGAHDLTPGRMLFYIISIIFVDNVALADSDMADYQRMRGETEATA